MSDQNDDIGTATYSPEDNKLRLYPFSRLSADDYASVRGAGFIWAPKQELFVAPMWTPDREDLLIELCGEVGDEDTSLVDRAEQRSERFDVYSEHRAKDAESARRAVSAIADGIPMGQPILVGHHSERHARKHAEQIRRGMDRAVKLWKTSQYWQSRAAGAIRHAKYKELPGVRARRIKGLEADRRKCERNLEASAATIQGWSILNAPRRDGTPSTPEVQKARAGYILSGDYSLWYDLDSGKLTPREALIRSCRNAGRCIAFNRRWIAHIDNRLLYEKAMLGEAGQLHRLDPKPKPKLAPLLNYREAAITIPNIYCSGSTLTYLQVEMTSAEYAKISTDYKATRLRDGSHRFRTAMQRHSLVSVFLTDSKVHDKPAPSVPSDRPAPAVRPFTGEVLHYEPTAPKVDPEPFEAIQDALKAGVQVVSAPQLFPTPAALAARVVELADIREGMRVLEPSAGTGNMLRAVFDAAPVHIVAVELNPRLLDATRAMWTTWNSRIEWKQADFLACNGELGTFDRIVMNPPFERGSDIRHINHAFEKLNPGGRLVAICAAGPRQREAFKDRGQWIDLPAGSFAESGTNVNTAIVILDKGEA